MVRIKPLMDDEIININDKEKDKYFKGAEGNTITMNYARGEEKFIFDKVIHPEEDQEVAFQNLCGPFIENFMDGYDVTMAASGQTGSGKTYTMIAPVGSLKKGHDLGGSILSHYGLFPRTIIDLFNRINGRGDVMTLSICQMGGFEYLPKDLIADQLVYFDMVDILEYIGLTEKVLESVSDIVKIMVMLEKKRYCEPTRMNQTSSRTNALISFRWYRKNGDKVCV